MGEVRQLGDVFDGRSRIRGERECCGGTAASVLQRTGRVQQWARTTLPPTIHTRARVCRGRFRSAANAGLKRLTDEPALLDGEGVSERTVRLLLLIKRLAGFHKKALDGYAIPVPRSGTTTWPRRGAATRHETSSRVAGRCSRVAAHHEPQLQGRAPMRPAHPGANQPRGARAREAMSSSCTPGPASKG